MRRAWVLAPLALWTAMSVAGCGGGGNAAPSGGSSGDASSASGSAAGVLPAGLDQGPRAGASAIDASQIEPGEHLFQTKGCSACHGFGKRVSCPDLLGVTKRRTAQWMENQILHPEIMTKHDPISHQLFAQYSLQMPNQGLTPEQAHQVIEFLKHKDHEAG
ncbi:MAG: cytochrome c, partial [Candidatus Eisenbacteria bacterium]|nr:cytochrome c [Candidatus Eisenbacteria bacterium]